MKKIGFIGLGIMGKPMSKNLIKGGFELVVCDIDAEAVTELTEAGAEAASSPREVVAKGAETIITMLPDEQAVEEVAIGKDGVLASQSVGTVLVDMSTVSPTLARRLAEELEEKGIEMLDAPVSGGEVGAIEGTLSIMVGGKQDVFDRALPVLQKMGKNVSYIGVHGAGQIAKAANQIIVSLTTQGIAEALVFAKKAGADPGRVREALLGGFAHSVVLDLQGKRMVERNFKPGGKVRLIKKDMEIVIAVAKEMGICLPGTAFVTQMWNGLAAQGGLDWDHSSLIKLLEPVSGV